jgi:hypothetical protein
MRLLKPASAASVTHGNRHRYAHRNAASARHKGPAHQRSLDLFVDLFSVAAVPSGIIPSSSLSVIPLPL